MLNDMDKIILKEESREVSDHIAGYVARQLTSICLDCCVNLLFDNNSLDGKYHQLVSRGGLKIASPQLKWYAAPFFALLGSAHIRKSDLSSLMAGEHILTLVSKDYNFSCSKHESVITCHAMCIIMNVFFNNQWKRTTETVVNYMIAAFKNIKRTK